MRMFLCCETWLTDMQETIWENRAWGRYANYIVPEPAQENVPVQLPAPPPQVVQQPQGNGGGGFGDMVMAATASAAGGEDEEMLDDDGDLGQFQWP